MSLEVGSKLVHENDYQLGSLQISVDGIRRTMRHDVGQGVHPWPIVLWWHRSTRKGRLA